MVRREMQFIAPRVARQGRASYARAVNEDVQRLAGGKKPLGEGVDRDRIEQVHRLDLDVETLQRAYRLVVITRRDGDLGACGTQNSRGLQTDTGIAAGDDCDPAGQVEALDNVGRNGSGAEARTDGFLQSVPIQELGLFDFQRTQRQTGQPLGMFQQRYVKRREIWHKPAQK
jgi:hypothetical protein